MRPTDRLEIRREIVQRLQAGPPVFPALQVWVLIEAGKAGFDAQVQGDAGGVPDGQTAGLGADVPVGGVGLNGGAQAHAPMLGLVEIGHGCCRRGISRPG